VRCHNTEDTPYTWITQENVEMFHIYPTLVHMYQYINTRFFTL